MSYEQKDNSGSLFRNDHKEQEGHADYTGSAKIQGCEYYINAWVNISKNGRKYFSFSFKPKLQSEKISPPTGGKNDPRRGNEDDEGFDYEIPF